MKQCASNESFFALALLRASWMLGGYAIAIVLGLSIVALESWSLGWRDSLYWYCVASIIATRWLDVVNYGGTTAFGRTVTRPMLVRWSLGVGLAFAGLWVSAHFVQLTATC